MDEFTEAIEKAEKKLKSTVPGVQEQLDDITADDAARRSYFVCMVQGIATTKRDLQKLLAERHLNDGECILVGREVVVKKQVITKVLYDFS